jgi:hypothetical protein
MWIALGVLAGVLAWWLWLPPSRELVLKLGTLLDMARRANPELYAQRIEPLSPFAGKQFRFDRIKHLLRADLSEFGALCQRLQRDAKRLDTRAHYGVLPIAAYVLGLCCWFALR